MLLSINDTMFQFQAGALMGGKWSLAIVMLLLAAAPCGAQHVYLYGGYHAAQAAEGDNAAPYIELGGGFLQGWGWFDADSAAEQLGISSAQRDTLCGTGTTAELPVSWTFVVYDTRGGTGYFSADALECTIPCSELLLRGDAAPVSTKGIIAQGGGGRVQPRVATVLPAADPAAKAAIVTELRGRGLAARSCLITDRVRADLDGDGRGEVVVCAQSRRGLGSMTSTRRSDWSGAFIIGDRRGDTLPMATVTLQFERYGEEASAAPTEFRLFGCYDLNGDGRMEVLLHWQYYEGSGVDVFTEADGRWIRVGGWGCGI
jgi:hypothetical protein